MMTYTNFEYPDHLSTRNQWLRKYRKVKEGEKPSAYTIIENEIRINLYSLNQTEDYEPSERTLAYWGFFDIFVQKSNRNNFLFKKSFESKWSTKTKDILSLNHIIDHINQKKIIGVKGTEKTRFVIIDLDYHNRDREIFLRQSKILIDEFYGKERWHIEVKNQDISGLHLINTFSKAVNLEKMTAYLRIVLIRLDQENPDLEVMAKNVGMTSFSNIEIYPVQNGNGIRLPLSSGRRVFIDRELDLIRKNGREVQDIVGYMNWLSDDKHRQWMSKELILGYLDYHTYENSSVITSKNDNFTISESKGWRGNMRKLLCDFWLSGNANGKKLNEHIIVLCRLAIAKGYSVDYTIAEIEKIIRQLPAQASDISVRLKNNECKKIKSTIESSAIKAESESNSITSIYLGRMKIDPFDPSTWHEVSNQDLTLEWSDEAKELLCPVFRKILFVKSDELILKFLGSIINLTIYKEVTNDGWGKDYLKIWLSDNFPEIKCGKSEKRHKIINALERCGIIRCRVRGYRGMATHWTIGKRSAEALGIEQNDGN